MSWETWGLNSWIVNPKDKSYLITVKIQEVWAFLSRKYEYEVIINKDSGSIPKRIVQRLFKTKSAALSFAKRWMRAHPNG